MYAQNAQKKLTSIAEDDDLLELSDKQASARNVGQTDRQDSYDACSVR